VIEGHWPQQGRRDAELLACLRQRGVPAGNIVFLEGARATPARLQKKLEGHLAQAAEGDLLIVYFCGHGERADDGSGVFCTTTATPTRSTSGCRLTGSAPLVGVSLAQER
jgi:hypothetical protein